MDTHCTTPSRLQASAWMLAVGALFLLIYGGTNQYSAGLTNLPSLYLPWERHIPFLPWSVVPYWSLDLLFVVSFYGLRSRTELQRHSARILFALGTSAVLFLLIPLQFAFERPPTEGLPGLLFAALSMDLPYNQLPSLHISLALIYWPVIRRMTPARLRTPAAVWFLLIGLSTLTTYQHHAIDLLGGLIVGALSLHLFPLKPADRRPVTPRMRRIGGIYGAASLLCLGTAISMQGHALWLLLPFTSLALVSGAYLAGRVNYLHKTAGSHCGVVWLLFGPFLIGQAINAWWHGRKHRPRIAEVMPGMYFGPRLSDAQARRLIADQQIGAVLDLSAELPECQPFTHGGQLDYRHLPMMDLVPPTAAQLRDAAAWVRSRHAPVYVHCSLGLGRSAEVARALLIDDGIDADQARSRILALQPDAVLATNTKEHG
ncbi:MAG: phosphatase PAP2/dual specificity phosphatase family protein [Gammaproteobacteria bacterium]